MWNRPAMVLWISVRIQNPGGKRRFSIGLPLPLILLNQWADMTEDVLTVARWFPGARRKMEDIPVDLIPKALRQFSRELPRVGPTDLVDVDVEKPDGQRVRVKCLLR